MLATLSFAPGLASAVPPTFFNEIRVTDADVFGHDLDSGTSSDAFGVDMPIDVFGGDSAFDSDVDAGAEDVSEDSFVLDVGADTGPDAEVDGGSDTRSADGSTSGGSGGSSCSVAGSAPFNLPLFATASLVLMAAPLRRRRA